MLYCRMELLVKWKERVGYRATYEELVRALLQIGSPKDAEFIVSLLAGTQAFVSMVNGCLTYSRL